MLCLINKVINKYKKYNYCKIKLQKITITIAIHNLKFKAQLCLGMDQHGVQLYYWVGPINGWSIHVSSPFVIKLTLNQFSINL